MSRFHTALACTLVLLCIEPAQAEIMREIEETSSELRKELEAGNAGAGLSPKAEANLRRLEQALANGERVNESLSEQVKALEDERAKLQQVQVVLTSGLVGALVTAIVAILGAFVTSRNSKPDRDLKRLAVIEKVRELKAANVPLPPDLARADGS